MNQVGQALGSCHPRHPFVRRIHASYFGELSRLRFMDEYWPCEMKEAATRLDGKQMLILSQLQTRVTLAQPKENPNVLPLGASCAASLAAATGLKLDDFAKITPYEFHGGCQYKVLMAAFPATPAPVVRVGDKPSDQNPVRVPFQHQFKQVFAIFEGLGSAKPSDRFTLDLKGKKISNANSAGLSFN